MADPTWDELNARRQELEARRNELMQQQTPREEVAQVNNAVDQIRDVLSSTSGDASEVKDEIDKHLGDLKSANAAIREALRHPQVQELTEGVTGGLDTAAGMFEAADDALGPIDQALDTLEQAFELADAQPTEQLEALASALEAASERLGPLIERIPGLGQFFELYTLAIRNIANSVGQIQAVQARLQRIWATVRPGTQMYLVPRTAQERLADEIRELDAEIGAIVQQMITVAQDTRDTAEASDGTPEPEVVVRTAESHCADQRIEVNNPQLLARNAAWKEFNAAEKRWSEASGQYDLACQAVDRAESALATATSPPALEGSSNISQLETDVEGARSARASAAEILADAEKGYDAASGALRTAQAAFDAERQQYIDCVKQEIVNLIPYSNRSAGFSDSDFTYLSAIYPEYAMTREEYEATRASTSAADEQAAAPPTTSTTGATNANQSLFASTRNRLIGVGLVAAFFVAAVATVATLAGGGDGNDDLVSNDVGSPTAAVASTSAPAAQAPDVATAAPTEPPLAISPISAADAVDTTVYSVEVEASEPVSFEWSGASCGEAEAANEQYTWDHRGSSLQLRGGIFGNQELSEDECEHEEDPSHAATTITVEIIGDTFRATCTYAGTATGTGPPCNVTELSQ